MNSPVQFWLVRWSVSAHVAQSHRSTGNVWCHIAGPRTRHISQFAVRWALMVLSPYNWTVSSWGRLEGVRFAWTFPVRPAGLLWLILNLPLLRSFMFCCRRFRRLWWIFIATVKS